MAEPYKSVLLFGGPGTGKGTQGKILGAIPGFFHCASGDIFRSVDRDSELGKIFHEYSSRGELVPDDLTVKMWQEAVRNRITAADFKPDRDLLLLDGIPRTVEQARIMGRLISVLRVLPLACDDPEPMFERLRRRALKEGRRDDADEHVIRNRWEVYERETAPVLAHYPPKLVTKINPIGTPSRVLRSILEVVEPTQGDHFSAFEG